MPPQHRPAVLLLVAVTLLCLLANTSCGVQRSTPSPSASAVVPTDGPLYISLGDSYAAGYQPGPNGGSTTRDGFPYQVVEQEQAAGVSLSLVNYGCSGVTSTGVVSDVGCAEGALGPGAPDYPDLTQSAAALALMKQHPGSVRLVTVVMGGNDLSPCLFESDGQSCVEQRLPVLRHNLDELLTSIRAAVGDTVPIVGLTYPDVYLGLYLKPDGASQERERQSLELFRTYLNPTLSAVYAAHGASFVDVTTLTGAYGSMNDTQEVDPFGTVPVPVARVCQLTWFCAVGDVHPNRAGHALIATAVVKAAKR